MELTIIESKLREMLLPILGFNSVEEVQPQHSLVHDLGAESLDFVEIMYVIERDFGVVLKTKEIIFGGSNITENQVFTDGKLTETGVMLITQQFPENTAKIAVGLTKVEIFSLITVRDLAKIISMKMMKVGV
jgi:acyl carrier protein